jgi:hypothetical protein
LCKNVYILYNSSKRETKMKEKWKGEKKIRKNWMHAAVGREKN